jgi:hypothetical protein
MQKKLITPLAVLLFSALCQAQEDSTEVHHPDSLHGSLVVQSSEPVGIWINEQAVGHTPFSMELPPGWAIYSARSPGHWTESFLVKIKRRETVSHEVHLKKYGMPAREMPDIAHINDLRTLESMYDSLSKIQPSASPDSLCIAHFVAEFPLPHSAPDTLATSSPQYRKYYEVYSNERQLSFNEFYFNCAGPVQQNLNAVLARINELGTERITGFVPVVEAEFIPTDASGLKGHLLLFLRSPDGRANVAWMGAWENEFLTGETLIRALTAAEPIALAFLTAQNKALWVPVEDGYSRHFYNYHNLNVSWNGLLFPMKGEFILPDWLAGLVPKDSLPQDTIKLAAQDTATINKAFLAQIPGGTFKYKGKVLNMEPFYINTTEISQSLYKASCGEKDFGKYKGDSLPAHSVNWKEANSCCANIGGDLPTEAEWEYAARAGMPNEYAWASNAKSHAVFDEAKPVKIAGKTPNGWGLYDMFGNVSEWVKDDGFWFGKYKYLKGGSWKSSESNLKVESKEEEDARYWGRHVGFRCVFKN